MTESPMSRHDPEHRRGDWWAELRLRLREPVARRTYAVAGFGLMFGKYLADAMLVRWCTGQPWTPVDYLSPLWTERSAKLAQAPPAFLIAMALWTLPFVWVGATLSIRRAEDAVGSGWLGLLFFVPIVNYALMLVLCLLPTRALPRTAAPAAADPRLGRPLFLVVGLAMLGGALTAFGVYAARSYGLALFVGTPFVLGVLTGFLFNRSRRHSLKATLMLTLLVLFMTGLLLLLFALEGIVCLAMAVALATVPAILGALAGLVLSEQHRGRLRHAALSVACLPLLALAEGQVHERAPCSVTSALDIAAPPAAVWQNVVSFSELPPPTQLLFRTGVAYPVRARVTGRGVGAVRRCEFSTGAFIEPITAWDEPRRLAFDVTAQPDAMAEWSFYRRVRPPHLARAFASVRGEFRLTALPGGGTRLQGTTWYALDLRPAWYWRLWADAFIHAIHGRVLAHIKTLSE
ncbi:MAG: SRPBCC family protein [Planctomycetota bacterium]